MQDIWTHVKNAAKELSFADNSAGFSWEDPVSGYPPRENIYRLFFTSDEIIIHILDLKFCAEMCMISRPSGEKIFAFSYNDDTPNASQMYCAAYSAIADMDLEVFLRGITADDQFEDDIRAELFSKIGMIDYCDIVF